MRAQDQAPRAVEAGSAHGAEGIEHQVQDDLLKLDAVTVDGRTSDDRSRWTVTWCRFASPCAMRSTMRITVFTSTLVKPAPELSRLSIARSPPTTSPARSVTAQMSAASRLERVCDRGFTRAAILGVHAIERFSKIEARVWLESSFVAGCSRCFPTHASRTPSERNAPRMI